MFPREEGAESRSLGEEKLTIHLKEGRRPLTRRGIFNLDSWEGAKGRLLAEDNYTHSLCEHASVDLIYWIWQGSRI